MPVCQRLQTEAEARESGNVVQSPEREEGREPGLKGFLDGEERRVGGEWWKEVSWFGFGFGVFLVNF